MPWWQSAVFSPSSSSSKDPKSKSLAASHQKRNNVRDINFFRNRKASNEQPRLTRARKLRHLNEEDIEGLPPLRSRSPLSQPDPMLVSRSPNNLEPASTSARTRPSSVVPHPLPIPELYMLLQRDSGFTSSMHTGDCPLPSPKEAPSRKDGEDGDRTDYLSGDGTEEGVSGRNPASRSAYQIIHRSAEHVDALSARSPTDRGRTVLHDSNGIDNVRSNYMLNVPINSAPTSGFNSPAHSPRRYGSGDFFPSPLMGSPGFQVWSAPEIPPLDMLGGLSPRASPEKFISSPDCSPLYSPTIMSPGIKPRSSSGAASPLHHKQSAESSSAWHESNGHVTVHPLPLPPGAITTSQPAFVHQTTPKPETSSMTSQWQKGKLIGRGTFGSVYVATNLETGALCAMKEVNLIPDDPKSVECMKQLEQEIKVLSQLKHRNIVQYYGSEIVEDQFYIFLEYVHPGSINKYVREHCGAITESIVRNFTRHILQGLAYLHSTKTIHRDIKGANLLVDAFGVVKLADFGMAKHLSGQAADLSLKGSPYWMAPEVMLAVMQKDLNCELALAVDIWSLGCTIIEMLTGKPPWSEFEGAAAMFKVLRESPPIPETLSPEGKDFLECCFRRNPAERPSASMLLEHRFVRTSHHSDVPAFTQVFAGMKLADNAHSPKEWTKYNKTDMLPISPSTPTTKGKLTFTGATIQRPHPETGKSAVVIRHSPRSTLEALPSLSPPHSNHMTQSPRSSPNVLNGIHVGVGSNNFSALPRTHGRDFADLF
ncbi:mitogen-activated protein kinase kinase kinase 5-like isoform X2 [Telopea speciosissima]|uniref:mitogen-activated protein kinase kinase kinase 5-like isoform X2 n=1 Tax=Telopea speciosissima TaxID=54955 RepID=UPI001CC7939D|nr:mitogen-activated protein kinase kinase kinase 5-like isoform X2 [Telopea speciosissima]